MPQFRRSTKDPGKFLGSPVRASSPSPTSENPGEYAQIRTATEQDGCKTQFQTVAARSPDGSSTLMRSRSLTKRPDGSNKCASRLSEQTFNYGDEFIREVEVIDKPGYEKEKESTDPNWRPDNWPPRVRADRGGYVAEGNIMAGSYPFAKKLWRPFKKFCGEVPVDVKMYPSDYHTFPEPVELADDMNKALYLAEKHIPYLYDRDQNLVRNMLTQILGHLIDLRTIFNRTKPGTKPEFKAILAEIIRNLKTDLMGEGRKIFIEKVKFLRSYVNDQLTSIELSKMSALERAASGLSISSPSPSSHQQPSMSPVDVIMARNRMRSGSSSQIAAQSRGNYSPSQTPRPVSPLNLPYTAPPPHSPSTGRSLYGGPSSPGATYRTSSQHMPSSPGRPSSPYRHSSPGRPSPQHGSSSPYGHSSPGRPSPQHGSSSPYRHSSPGRPSPQHGFSSPYRHSSPGRPSPQHGSSSPFRSPSPSYRPSSPGGRSLCDPYQPSPQSPRSQSGSPRPQYSRSSSPRNY